MAFGDHKYVPDTPLPITETQMAKWKVQAMSWDYGRSADEATLQFHLVQEQADNDPAKTSGGQSKSNAYSYQGADARAKIDTLDTRDSTLKPDHELILEWLEADGKLPSGTIT